jgi:hypothetical protein
MSSHPVNLGLRFLLEISGLLALGYWGRGQGDGWLRYALAIVIYWLQKRVYSDRN